MAVVGIEDGLMKKIKDHIKAGLTGITDSKKYVTTAIIEQMQRDAHPEINQPKIIVKTIHNPNSGMSRKDLFIFAGLLSAVMIVNTVIILIITGG